MYKTLNPSVEELELDGYYIEDVFIDEIVDKVIFLNDMEDVSVNVLDEIVRNQLVPYYETHLGQPTDDDEYDIMFDDGDIDHAMDLINEDLIKHEIKQQTKENK